MRRPPRISIIPVSPRAARATRTLASVTATSAAASIAAASSALNSERVEPGADSREIRDARQHLGGLQLSVASGAEHSQEARQSTGRTCRDHHRIAERAGEPRLRTVGDRVPADVDEEHEVASQVGTGGADASRGAGSALGHVDQDRGLAQVSREVRLAEVDSFGRGRADCGIDNGSALERPCADDFARPARARMGVHDDPLPGDATENRFAAARLEGTSNGYGANRIAAAADAEHQRTRAPRDRPGDSLRVRPALLQTGRRRRGPSPRRGRTLLPPSPGSPRREGRGRSRPTSGTRGTRREPAQ